MWELVSDYVGTYINVLSVLVFAKLVLRESYKISKTRVVILTIIVSLFLHIFCFFDLRIFKTVVFFLSYLFFLKYIYSIDIFKAVILDFFYFVFLILSDMASIKLLTYFLGEKKFYGVIAGSIFGNIVVLFPFILFTILFRKIIYKFFNTKIKYKLIFLLIISLLCIVAVFFATFSLGSNAVDKWLCFFCIVVIVSALCYSFTGVYKNNQLMLEYSTLLSFIKKYEVEIDNQRTFMHETKNQFLTIKSKIIDKESDKKVVEYIDEIINDDRKVKYSEYSKLNHLPSNGIKGLLYFKISAAQDNDIKVGINVSKRIEDSFLGNLDSLTFNQIGKILGVYLDNAIEGAANSKDKMIGIEIFQSNMQIKFVISNSYNKEERILGRSSKGQGRGYGLLLVNSIINGNQKFSTSTEITDDLYVKKLVINKT